MLNLERREMVVLGTDYAGEMKKGVFTAMNYWMPQSGVLSMHCRPTKVPKGDTSLFFGLSGTGKTTLSSDPAPPVDRRRRALLERQGHLQYRRRLLRQVPRACRGTRAGNLPGDPVRHGARKRRTRSGPGVPDFDDRSLTENTRACYPIEYIDNAQSCLAWAATRGTSSF